MRWAPEFKAALGSTPHTRTGSATAPPRSWRCRHTSWCNSHSKESFLRDTPKPAGTHLEETLLVNVCGVQAGLATGIIRAPATMTGCRNVRNSGAVLNPDMRRRLEYGQGVPACPQGLSPQEGITVYPPTLWCRSWLCPSHSTIPHHSLTGLGFNHDMTNLQLLKCPY